MLATATVEVGKGGKWRSNARLTYARHTTQRNSLIYIFASCTTHCFTLFIVRALNCPEIIHSTQLLFFDSFHPHIRIFDHHALDTPPIFIHISIFMFFQLSLTMHFTCFNYRYHCNYHGFFFQFPLPLHFDVQILCAPHISFCLVNCVISCVYSFALVALGVYGVLALSPEEQYDSERCQGVLVFQSVTAYSSTSLVSAFLHFFMLICSSFGTLRFSHSLTHFTHVLSFYVFYTYFAFHITIAFYMFHIFCTHVPHTFHIHPTHPDVYLKRRRSPQFARLSALSWSSTVLLAVLLALVHVLRIATLAVATLFLEFCGHCSAVRDSLFRAVHPFLLVNWISLAWMVCFALVTLLGCHVATNFCIPFEEYDTLELPEAPQT